MTAGMPEAHVDVVVMGGGACGTIAALAARAAGADVLLVERDANPFGTTGMSMGLICAAGTAAQARHGVSDGADTFFADIMAKTRGQADPVLARSIAAHSGPALDWLVDCCDVPLDLDVRFRAAYGNSRLRVHGWPGHDGQDLLALLHRRVADVDTMVMTGTRVVALRSEPGRSGAARISGVELLRPDGARETVSCGALVMASGGFAASTAMLARHIPAMASARNNGHEGSQGDAVRLASPLGAGLGDMGAFQGYAMLADPHGISVPPGYLAEGGVLVNAMGARFVDEMEDIAGMVHDVLAQPGATAWVVFDPRIEAANSYQPDAARLVAMGAPRRASDVAKLADVIGADRAVLGATLAEAQAAAAERRPDAFARRWSPETPPPGAGPGGEEGLAAIRVTGAIYHTQGGLQIDGSARALDTGRVPFANLFAGGGAARSVSGPSSWGYLPAMGLCTAMTFGRLAGEGAALAASG
ncbi:FAD-dependent oxidoreductase [Novosphingobium resinovorum]|uniref:FAD-dependent oxidoreductase n=1 Tax=Novosphingobium resinovorum TaxID=158500 RepID=UPI002ED181A1|nr:FAD-dependent oxidoreductase [Novosphingobium resinovorum]